MQKFEFNKLVRDKIPELMAQEGVIIHSRILSTTEYAEQLKQKLVEEAKEVAIASDDNQIKHELADVLEVINALCSMHKISIAEIEEIRIEKSKTRGAFLDKHYINYVEVPKDNKKVLDYLNDKNKYKEKSKS